MPETEARSLDDLVARIDAAVPLAGPGAVEDASGARPKESRHVVFALAGMRCAVPIENVVETGYVPSLSWVPNVPRWVIGVTNLRGDVLAVVDLRSFLGFEPLERREAGRLLVTQSTVFDCRVGFLVDGLHGALALSPEARWHAGASIDGRISGFLRGAVELEGRVVHRLDLEAVFRVDEMRRLQEG